MSVPPDRMAARTPGTIKDPNKIMGLPKWAFFAIIIVGVVLAWYIYKRSQSSNAAALQTANAGTEPDTTNGVTAADIGGTPADNSFTTQTDAQALEEQIQSLQDSLFQLQQSNNGNGAGITTGPGGATGSPSGVDITGTQSSGGQPVVDPLPTPGGITGATSGGITVWNGHPIENPLPTPLSGPTNTPTVPIGSPILTPGGGTVGIGGSSGPGSGPVMTPQSNAPGDLNLVSQGLTPATVGPHMNPY